MLTSERLMFGISPPTHLLYSLAVFPAPSKRPLWHRSSHIFCLQTSVFFFSPVAWLHLCLINLNNQWKAPSSLYFMCIVGKKDLNGWVSFITNSCLLPDTGEKNTEFLQRNHWKRCTGLMFTTTELPFPTWNWLYSQITPAPMFKSVRPYCPSSAQCLSDRLPLSLQLWKLWLSLSPFLNLVFLNHVQKHATPPKNRVLKCLIPVTGPLMPINNEVFMVQSLWHGCSTFQVSEQSSPGHLGVIQNQQGRGPARPQRRHFSPTYTQGVLHLYSLSKFPLNSALSSTSS